MWDEPDATIALILKDVGIDDAAELFGQGTVYVIQ